MLWPGSGIHGCRGRAQATPSCGAKMVPRGWMCAAALLALASRGDAARGWPHGWTSGAEMTFADFNPPELLTDAQARFVTDKYRIVSLEKCTGRGSGLFTEEAIYRTARQLKRIRPDVKVLFYLHTGHAGFQCYAAAAAFAARPELWLRDDNGNLVEASPGVAVPDVTNPAARAFWTAIPLAGMNGTGMFDGTPVAELIDGVLADGAGYEYRANFTPARLQQLADARLQMVGELQGMFDAANGGVVVGNGISMYGGRNADPRYLGDYNLRSLDYVGGIMNEHTAVFESVNARNASLNVETVAADLRAVEAAASKDGGAKVVAMQTWPGLYVNTNFFPKGGQPANCYPPVSAGGEPTPQTPVEWQAALRRHFAFAYATYLSVARANVYFFYGGVWYPSTDGIIACPDAPATCPAPPEWYPDLARPLGAPLQARQPSGPYRWTRRFEHATVYLDLRNTAASNVTFHTP